jgi:hypothetical protein
MTDTLARKQKKSPLSRKLKNLTTLVSAWAAPVARFVVF